MAVGLLTLEDLGANKASPDYPTPTQKQPSRKIYPFECFHCCDLEPWHHVVMLLSFELSFYGLVNPNEHGVIDGQSTFHL